MAILRRRRSTDEPPDLVELPVGFDRTAAMVLVARCEASGIPAKLLTMDENGLVPGTAALAEHRLLVRAQDRERVELLLRHL